MLLSMVPFLILQLPKILDSPSGTRVAILVSLLVTIVFLVGYWFYQVFQPWIQNRRFEYLSHKYVEDKLLRLLTRNGSPNVTFMKELFHEVDKNENAYITPAELRALILGMKLEEAGGSNADKFVEKVMEGFDTSSGNDAAIDEAQFVKGMLNYISHATQSSQTRHQNGFRFFSPNSQSTEEEVQGLMTETKGDDESESAGKSWLNYVKAGFLVLLGTAITVLFGQPLIETVEDFATSANISSFNVSYVAIPLALNYRQAVAAITAAKQKTPKAISLTLSQIYSAVFMNNMMGLSMLLAVVYIRDLSWDASAEVLVVLIICTVAGIFASACTKFPVWTSLVAGLLYPISLLLLYVLTTVFGWA